MSRQSLTPQQQAWVDALLAQMTVEEKAGQLHQLSPSIVGGFDVSFEELIEMFTDGRISPAEFGKIMSTSTRDYHEDDIRAGRVSSYLLDDPETANRLQKIAVEESRLGIPLLFGLDVIHGYRTVFPIPLAETCSWDTELFEASARVAAREASARGVRWTFAPMVDVARDARWGRISESPGEDPYLAAEYARAKVWGFQGRDGVTQENVASCLKHFVGYGAVEGGRDYNTVSMSRSMLHNGYLPPVKAGVEAGAMTVMAAFNDVNGVPCTVNGYLLRDILKERYGFGGFVVSDATAIRECVTHGIAADLADASLQSIRAGLDMDMNSCAYHNHLAEQVRSGAVPMELLDDAVRRVLEVKTALGLFEDPYVSLERAARYETLPQDHLDLALEAAEKSIVLLKNQGELLPLSKSCKIALVGALADQPAEVLGAWAISGRESDCVSIRAGLEKTGVQVAYAPVCGPADAPDSEQMRRELEAAAAGADVIVAVVGESTAMSGEAASRSDITLPGKQRKLLELALATGKSVAAVLVNGRPLALQWEDEHIPAILECWQLGVRMGDAVAAVLLGECAPTGKLCCTFPAVTGQCPSYYNHPNTGRPGSKSKFTSRYLDAPVKPLYPFGHGLTYTKFQCRDLQIAENGDALEISVVAANTGKRPGVETLQLYLRDVTASLVRPVQELKGFCKVFLDPGGEKTVGFTLPKADMGFYDDGGNYRLEPGEFVISVGGSSEDVLKGSIWLKF